jgi:hypothetical protein
MPALRSFHTDSDFFLEPFTGNDVPPHASTYGLEAGKFT